MKAAIVDGVAFLDDRNWPADRRNVVVADSDANDVQVLHDAMHGKTYSAGAVAVTKGAALFQEAGVLAADVRAGRSVCMQSESFTAGSPPYGELKALARSGVHVKLLICENDLKEASFVAARALARSGVAVRVTDASEKFAVAGTRAWIGSANATYGAQNQIDWGMQIKDAHVCKELQARFDSTWRHAKRFAG